MTPTNFIKNILTANSTIAEAKQAHADLLTRYEALEASVAEYKNTIETFAGEKETFLKQIEDLKADTTKKVETVTKENETAIAALVEVAKEESESASDKAVDIVAALGVDQASIPTSNSDIKISHEKEMAKLQGPALSNYFVANRKAIFEEKKASKKTLKQ